MSEAAVDYSIGLEEQERPELVAFKEKIAKADGRLIHLAKKTMDGKDLFVTAQYIEAPPKYYQDPEEEKVVHIGTPELNPKVNKDSWIWNQESIDGKATGVLLIDVYTKDGKNFVPLGHRDWLLSGDFANGGGSMRDALYWRRLKGHELSAWRRWDPRKDPIPVRVEPNYQKQGIGAFMMAASTVVLPELGVKKFRSSPATPGGKAMYKRFDLNKDDFNKTSDGTLPFQRLSQHPFINETLDKFV